MGCRTEPSTAAQDAAPPPPPLAVELVGAKAWRRGAPPIFSDDARPRIILSDRIGAIEAFAGDRPAALAPQPTSAGHVAYALRFEPPEGPFELRVRDRHGREVRWPVEWFGASNRAAFEAIERLVGQARALHAEGQQRAAERLRRQAAQAAEAADLMSVAAGQWRALAFRAYERKDLNAQGDALAEAERLIVPGDHEGQVALDYYRGLGATLEGELREAERRLASTIAAAEHHGLGAWQAGAAMALANLRVRQGRFGSALQALKALEPGPDASSASKQLWHNNYGWALVSGMAGGALPIDWSMARWHLEESVSQPSERPALADVHANLAGAALEEGDLVAAAEALDQAEALDPHGATFGADWRRLVAAELDVARGSVEQAEHALLSIAALEPSRGAHDPETSWRAIAALAQLYQDGQDTAAAAAMFAEATHRVDRLSVGIELAGGSGAYFASRKDLFDAQTEFLLNDPSKPPGERALAAWIAVDASEARVVQTLQRRSQAIPPEVRERARAWLAARARFEDARSRSWSVPAAQREAWRRRREAAHQELTEELRALMDVTPVAEPLTAAGIQSRLPPGALLLSYREIAGRTHAFLVGAHTVKYREVTGGALLGPWEHEIRAATHLFWIPGNAAAAARLDQAAVGAGPLAAAVPQSRLPFAGLLMQTRARPEAPPVVVVDPDGNLPLARDEARQIPGRRLTGDAAHRSAVLEAIDGARLFHFAGHGVLRPDAPWDAHLRLARQTRLNLGDVLTARPAVGVVVLNGCSTGAQLDLGGEERIGLPTGFLLAGARFVLATRVDIPDTAARRFIDRFYAAGGADAPARAFRDAVRASLAANDPVWMDFELMGRP